jgi:hypothetical protein
VPRDQHHGGGKFHDDREANQPDERRILTHQRSAQTRIATWISGMAKMVAVTTTEAGRF